MREPKRGDTASRGSRSSAASIQLFMAVDAGPFEFLWRPLPWKQDGFRGCTYELRRFHAPDAVHGHGMYRQYKLPW